MKEVFCQLVLVAVVLFSSFLAGCTGGSVKGKIVFQSNRDGNFDIYSMQSDGTDLKRLTKSSSYDVMPSWSPDGSQILFASDRAGNWDVYVMHSDGSDVKRLTAPPGSNTAPSWGRKGEKIVFVSTRDALNGELYMMNADGSNVERLTRDAAMKDAPVFTPDGASVVYTVGTNQGTSFALLGLADKRVSVLSSTFENAGGAKVSRDDGLVVFAASQGGRPGIFTMSVAGKDLKCVLPCDDLCQTPCWGASADEVIYAKRDGLFILSLGTRKETRLSTKGDSFPDWTGE